MFDLDSSILAWRKRMLSAGVKSPDPMDELECHLRDDLEHQMRAGWDAQIAFEAAVKHIGAPVELQREFNRTRTLETMKTEIMQAHLRSLLAAIAVAAIGVGLALPAIAKSRVGELVTFDMTAGTLGLIATLVGVAWTVVSSARLLKERSKA